MPDGACKVQNGTAKGQFYRSITGELHHDGFAYAKFFQDENCKTELYVHRLNDNRCDLYPPNITAFDQNGNNYKYSFAGYCCACGDSYPWSCAFWDGGKFVKCFSGC